MVAEQENQCLCEGLRSVVSEQCLCIICENGDCRADAGGTFNSRHMNYKFWELVSQRWMTQLQLESARAQTAEQERRGLILTLGAMRTNPGDAMIDTKGIGQPFTLKGTSDQEFGEWTHKVRTFTLARFGEDILTALTWAARQQRIVVKTCVASQRNRTISWNIVFGDQAAEDAMENIDDFVGKLYAYFVSFTTDGANRIVRNSGEGNGLEAWRRLEYDPTSSMRTCVDSSASSEPTALPAS